MTSVLVEGSREGSKRRRDEVGESVRQVTCTATGQDLGPAANVPKRAGRRASLGDLAQRTSDGAAAVHARAALPGRLVRQVARHAHRLGDGARPHRERHDNAAAERRAVGGETRVGELERRDRAGSQEPK